MIIEDLYADIEIINSKLNDLESRLNYLECEIMTKVSNGDFQYARERLASIQDSTNEALGYFADKIDLIERTIEKAWCVPSVSD